MKINKNLAVSLLLLGSFLNGGCVIGSGKISVLNREGITSLPPINIHNVNNNTNSVKNTSPQPPPPAPPAWTQYNSGYNEDVQYLQTDFNRKTESPRRYPLSPILYDGKLPLLPPN
jgi:hypothetical protein